jgi:hypothetical protein
MARIEPCLKSPVQAFLPVVVLGLQLPPLLTLEFSKAVKTGPSSKHHATSSKKLLSFIGREVTFS